MKRVLMISLLLCVSFVLHAQIRVERDADGNVRYTNRLDGSSKSAPKSAAPKIRSGARNRPPEVTPEMRRKYEARLRDACRRKGLNYRLVRYLVEAESSFQPFTLSRKGAIGLMQLMPATAKRFKVKDPWDPYQNIEGGTSYLQFLMGHFKGSIPLVLAGYNAGENAVAKYRYKIPPYRETVHYVFKILHNVNHPELIVQAKDLLARPGDYQKYYLSYSKYHPHGGQTRTYYIFVDRTGVRHFTDAPPTRADVFPVVYKDD